MNFIKKKLSTILIITVVAGISLLISNKIDFSSSTIIQYEYISNALLTLFSVSLAIVAIIITLLEKYKEKGNDSNNWGTQSSDILKELSENTIFLLLLYIATIVCSIFDLFITFKKIDIPETILIFSLCSSIIITLDTTISIYSLVKGLKDIISSYDSEELYLSQKEKYVIEAYRFLNQENKTTVDKLIKSIATNQQVENK